MEAIPSDYIKTVVFLCVDEPTKNGTNREPKATGFFVRVPIEDTTDYRVDYVVTARHCIDKARQYGKLYVRFNLKNGTYTEIPTNPDDWCCHPSSDVAAILTPISALPKGVGRQDVDQSSILMESFVGADYTYKGQVPLIGQHEIRPDVGHQIYYIGLFTEHHGQERNLPIVRFGHISRMPSKLKMRLADNIEFTGTAYLVELQSWGGSSGSPVFFLHPIMFEAKGQRQLSNDTNIPVGVNLLWATGFMGLINGHYPIRQQAVKTEYSPDIEMDLNTGMAVVTPAEAVTQLLMREDLVEYRKKLSIDRDKNKGKFKRDAVPLP